MRLAALLLAATCLLPACRAPRDDRSLDDALAGAVARMDADGPRPAQPLFEQALKDARRSGSRRHEALALGYLGTCYKRLGEYRRALELHEQSLALRQALHDELGVAKSLSNIGLVHEALGNCAGAIAHYDRSLAILGRLGARGIEATVINNRALCLDNLGQYDRSAADYERSLALHRGEGDEVGAARALGNLGGVALLRGRYADADRYYRQALEIDERHAALQATALDLINLGDAAAGLGTPGAALDAFSRARRLAEAAGLARETADADRGRSEVLADMGRYEDARAALQSATAAYERAGLAHEQIDARLVAGQLALALGDVAGADAAFSAARDASERAGLPALVAASVLAAGDVEARRRRPDAAAARYLDGQQRAEALGDHTTAARAAAHRADASLAAGHTAAALDAARAAVTMARRGRARVVEGDAQVALGAALLAGGSAGEALTAYEAAAAIGDETAVSDLQWRAAAGRGAALEILSRPDAALAGYMRAVEIIESVRERLRSSRDRSGYLDDKRHVYAALVRLLIRLGRTDEAFRIAERLRSGGYLDLLARSVLLAEHPHPTAAAGLLARLARLQQRVSSREAETDRGHRDGETDAIRGELRLAEREWIDALDALAPHDPVAAALRRQPPLGPRDVQVRLGADQALVQYIVDDREATVFVITPSRIRALTLPVAASVLRTRIELLRGLVRNTATDDWAAPAARLYADLIEPLVVRGWLRGIRRLLVVPHAELNYVPFSLLAREPRPDSPLLVDEFAISMLPAASALVVQRRAPGEPHGGLFAVAPQPARLPFSQAEVGSVGALFPARPRVLVGALATERVFKEQAPGYAVLHLATHGLFNRVDPLFSGLELAPDRDEDGRLQVFEILGLELHASLVTLSACDTALAAGELTDTPAGEEFIGLTRAFLSAGGRNVLASLWEVSDRATPALMESFYRDARTMPVADALARAQRQRLHAQAPLHHPFYWAGFVTFGRGDQPIAAQTRATGP